MKYSRIQFFKFFFLISTSDYFTPMGLNTINKLRNLLSISNNYPLIPAEHLPWTLKKYLQVNSLCVPIPTSSVLACYFSKWQLHFSSNQAKETLGVILDFLLLFSCHISYLSITTGIQDISFLLRPLICVIELLQTISLLCPTPSIGSLSHSE